MSAPNAVKLIGEGAKLLSQVPTSTLSGVVDVIRALAAGRVDQAERLAKNSALAIAAKRATAERIKASKR